MFIRKQEYEKMKEEIKSLRKENLLLTRSEEKWSEESKRMREDLDYEHLENQKNHKVLLAIKKMYNTSYGTISALIQFRKDVKKELDNAVNID